MADTNCIVPAIFFVVACLFGMLTIYAKERLRDKTKTQFFAIIAVMATVAFVMWALIFL
jgi:uncharacterized membrane protein YhaH (DUF805 family)